jgi:surfactin synthase thioesterase subunit
MTTRPPAAYHGSATRWTPWNQSPAPSVHLGQLPVYCLPHAGGGGTHYLPWLRQQHRHGLEIVPVELPGRGRRLFEDPYSDLDELTTDLADELFAALAPESFVLFGHSMGAYLAYEVTRKLAARGGALPAQLVLSGVRPPGAPPAERFDDLSTAGLLKSLTRLGGTPSEVLERPDLLELVLPALRADLTIVGDFYDTGRLVPLPCPITVFGGRTDHLAGPEWLPGWSGATTGRFAVKVFPGGHFYLHDHPAEVLRELAAVAESTVDRF